MLKKRKAQGLSITVIVVAVIALIIIVVLVAVFSGRMGAFSRNVDNIKQGTCVGTCTTLGKLHIWTKNDGSKDNPKCGDELIKEPNEQIVSGDFSDAVADKVCCCY